LCSSESPRYVLLENTPLLLGAGGILAILFGGENMKGEETRKIFEKMEKRLEIQGIEFKWVKHT
jgi:hypothetical protein